MRIADIVFRQGHLSEEALTAIVLGGERPSHLDTCEACSQQLYELSRWLTDVRADALEAADEAFPPEKLALQQSQIMRRLEQLDEPPRVIAFPAQAVAAPRTDNSRRVAPAWVGVAAAAGLVIGLVGGQLSARLTPEETGTATQTEQSAPASIPAASSPTQPSNASLLDYDFDRHVPDDLLVYDQLTPALVDAQFASAR